MEMRQEKENELKHIKTMLLKIPPSGVRGL
jgi:hypothetical protein